MSIDCQLFKRPRVVRSIGHMAAVGLLGCVTTSIALSQTISVRIERVPTEVIPDNLETRGSTEILGINDRGQYVGGFGQRDWVIWDKPHGFVHTSRGVFGQAGAGEDRFLGFRLGTVLGTRYEDPKFHYFDLFPDEVPYTSNIKVSMPTSINDAGTIVGTIAADSFNFGPYVGFIFNSKSGSFRTISVPGALSTEPRQINNRGVIVGNYVDRNYRYHGFVFEQGRFKTIDIPCGVGDSLLRGINDNGAIVGYCKDSGDAPSFVYRSGEIEWFTADGQRTRAEAINNSEEIVGYISIPAGPYLGFHYKAGVTVVLDFGAVPGSSTVANAISNAGRIAGHTTAKGTSWPGQTVQVGFLATVRPDTAD